MRHPPGFRTSDTRYRTDDLKARFVELRDGCTFLVLDMKDEGRPVIVCRCEGFNAPLNAEYISAALQFYHNHLMEKVLGDDLQPDLASEDIDGCGPEGC